VEKSRIIVAAKFFIPTQISVLYQVAVKKLSHSSFISIYSQTCIKRSPLGPRKSDRIRQVTSFNRGDRMGKFDCSFKLIEIGFLTLQEKKRFVL